MNVGRARRLLLAAFLISLLIHAIFAFFWHRQRAAIPDQVEVVSIAHRLPVIRRQPTPPPRPKATPVPHPAESSKPAPKASQGPSTAQGGTGQATARPTAAPTSAATIAAHGCAQPNADAAVTENPQPADVPAEVRAQNTSGIALVKVQLDATGAIIGTTVAQSTGNSSLDLVAVGMARDAKYSPALKACKPVASAYEFSVKFVAW
jgi:protein TonB